MKTLKTVAMGCVLLIAVMFFLAGSCVNNGLPEYYVAFTIEGQESVFEFGATGVEEDAFAFEDDVGDGQYNLVFFASPGLSGASAPDTYIWITIYDVNVGGTGTYTWPAMEIYYLSEGNSYFLETVSPPSITIESYGGIDGTIEGTFTARVNDGAVSHDVTGGKFRVKRIDYSGGFPPWA